MPNSKGRASAKGLDSNDSFPATLSQDSAAPRDPETLHEKGTLIGRYVVLEQLGRGGFGVVYRAYDPKLDRQVALKVLKFKRREQAEEQEARDRLLREAQALAQLAHPNVVAVHDVGTLGDEVFVAMELVEGRTLKDWILEKKPSQRKILEAFVAAGRGLAAAHKVGIIHRDIKPQNVIVGEDGRVRVLDFGLARSTAASGVPAGQAWSPELAETPPPESDVGSDSESSQSSVPSEKRLSNPLTLEGVVLGTPGYMAPEQYLGKALTQQTDQFSFCVMLYEALYGKRPFAGKTYRTVRYKVVIGKIDPPPPKAKVPLWLRRIVLRGLAKAEADRYPGMDALLADLSRDPLAVRRRAILAGVILLLVGGSFALASALQDGGEQRCRGFAAKLGKVWDPSAQKAVQESFLATGRPYAADTFGRVKARLDEVTADWVAMRTEACEATHLRGEQSEKLLDLRMACLDQRRSELSALTAVFADASGPVIDRAVKAALDLKGLERCADAEALQAAVPPPEDPRVAAQVALVRDKLSRVRALIQTGQYEECDRLADQVAAEARSVEYLPLQADALLALGIAHYLVMRYPDSEKAFQEAARLGARIKDADLVAEALIREILVVGFHQARSQDGLALRRAAEIVLAFQDKQEKNKAFLYNILGIIYGQQGKLDQARKLYERSLQIRLKVLGPEHPAVIANLTNLGILHLDEGDYEAARKRFKQALTLQEKNFGTEHPEVAVSLINLGIVAQNLGEPSQAVELYRRAQIIYERTWGPESAELAPILENLGGVLADLGEFGQAQGLLERSLALRRKALGEDHPEVALALTNLGLLAYYQRQWPEARARFEAALKSDEKTYGLRHTRVALSLNNLGVVALAQGKLAEARASFERALSILKEAQVARPEDLLWSTLGLGECGTRQGQNDQARPALEEALRLCERVKGAPEPCGRASFALAKLLARNEPARARALATEARDKFARRTRLKDRLIEVERWLGGAWGT